jgi:hydroxymethylpyrimidine pyrophosphatase-like HAD family hydrolase
MTEVERIAYAKSFIDKLANGINPIDDTPIPDGDIANHVRLSRCFFYVSGILQKEIDSERRKEAKTKKAERLPFTITREQLENFEEFVMTLDNIESIAVFFAGKEDEVRCKEILSKNSNLFMATAWNYSFEIFSADAGKEKALQKLFDMIDIDFEDVIYLGDNDNDIETLKLAGLGLCAGNGSESAKKAADKIICTNNENVIEYTLNEILLK